MSTSFFKRRNRKHSNHFSRTRFAPGRCIPLSFESLEKRLALATYIVGNTLDSGSGSLRQAIIDSNANLGADLIAFNIGGGGIRTVSLASALPIVTDPLTIDGTSQPGYAGSPIIEVNGASALSAGGGIVITAGNSTVRGLVVNNFASGYGIVLSSRGGNHVEGCYLGTDVTGTLARGNRFAGLYVLNSADNIIGGTAPGTGNLLSGNLTEGILFGGLAAQRNQVQGNRIGTNAAGTAIIPNNTGVNIGDNAGQNTIGGVVPAARNIISGNLTAGVATSGTNLGGFGGGDVIIGNYIGTDVTGTVDLGNRSVGVFSGANIRIGGTAAGEGNLISGNNSQGIRAGGTQIVIQGNLIGTDASGNASLGNGQAVNTSGEGVRLESAPNALVAGNVISGNYGVGFFITSSEGIRVEANRIGTNAAGTGALKNASHGVWFPSANTNAMIGGMAIGAGNVIAFNQGDGVNVGHQSATGVGILGNSIFSNDGLGIDLASTLIAPAVGVTPNDLGDADDGSNHLQNFPVLTAATTSENSLAIMGTLNSKANKTYRVEFFASAAQDPTKFGEGQRFLGFTSVTTDGNGNVLPNGSFSISLPGTVSVSEFITATATDNASANDPGNNTSEFSQVRIVIQGNRVPNDLTLSKTSVPENQPIGTLVGAFTTLDPDVGNSHTYGLAAGAGDIDNPAFTIVGNELRAAATFDVEARSSYIARVRTTDQGGLFFEKSFTINVSDVNEPPVINNGDFTVPENTTAAGTVTATDPDAGASLVFSLAGGLDYALFRIDATTGALAFKIAPDFEAPTDNGGNNVYDVIVQQRGCSKGDWDSGGRRSGRLCNWLVQPNYGFR